MIYAQPQWRKVGCLNFPQIDNKPAIKYTLHRYLRVPHEVMHLLQVAEKPSFSNKTNNYTGTSNYKFRVTWCKIN